MIRYSKFDDDELITIKLKNTTQTYKVQISILREALPYFEKALSGDFKEAHLSTLTLPDFDLRSLQLLIYWLCKRDLPGIAQEADKARRSNVMSADDGERIIVDLQMVLIRLWILADKVAMRKMQNDAMEELLIMFRTCEVRPEAARFSWDATTDEKMLDAIVF